jgi:hypothetical protein
MTDDEILQIAKKQTGESKTFEEWALSFARVIIPAQPEPEPVAYINVEERKLEWATPIKWETPTVVKMGKVPLYTAPPQHEYPENFIDALKFHTAMQELEPEPMAVVIESHEVGGVNDLSYYQEDINALPVGTKLYTAPPQREWVELTDDEMLMIYAQPHEGFKYSLGRMIQVKLKEKNIF